jgi:hypothetical protein
MARAKDRDQPLYSPEGVRGYTPDDKKQEPKTPPKEEPGVSPSRKETQEEH